MHGHNSLEKPTLRRVNPGRNLHPVTVDGRSAGFLSWYLRRTVLVIVMALALFVPLPPVHAACGSVTDVANETELNAAIAAFNALPAGACVFTIRLIDDIPLTASTNFIYNSRAGVELVLDGQGFNVDGQGNSNVRVFSIANAVVTMKQLTITGANVGSQGSGINNNRGTLTLEQSVVVANQGGFGAINNSQGVVTLIESEIKDNTSTGLHSTGSGADVTLWRSTISGNSGASAGGINNYTVATLIESTVISNTGSTGGIFNSGGSAVLSLVRSTINGNATTTFGGGITNSGIVTATNSTISGNTGGVGGIQNTGRLTLAHATITDNSATNTFLRPGGVYMGAGGTMTLANSLIADQRAGADCDAQASISVAITSNGHNLDSDATCLPPSVALPSDIPSGNAVLAPLAFSGGPTASHQPQSGSDALDAVPAIVVAAQADSELAVLASCVGTNVIVDQHNIARPQGDDCDIGSMEYTLPLAVTVGWFSSERAEEQVNVRWQTSTESGTAGFQLMAATAGAPTPLHSDLIPSAAIDSIVPQDYALSVVTEATQFYLHEIGIDGQIVEHGPYALGLAYGAPIIAQENRNAVTIWLPIVSNSYRP